MSDTLVEVAIRRGEVRDQIIGCRRCSYSTNGTCNGPVPFRGPTPARLMLLAEAPGVSDDMKGIAFSGGGARSFEQMLRDAGLPDLAKWFITHTVCCKPPESVPQPAYVQACSPNLRDQVALASPEWIVTLGVIAMGATGATGKLSSFHGRPFLVPAGPLNGRWVFPTYHPMAIYRDETVATKIGADLDTFKRVLDGTITRESIAARVGRKGKLFV